MWLQKVVQYTALFIIDDWEKWKEAVDKDQSFGALLTLS